MMGVFTHPLQILHTVSLPGFAHAGQHTELNQTLSKDKGYIGLINCRNNFGVDDLIANKFVTEHAIDNRETAFETTNYILPAFDELWSTNG